MMDDPEDRVAHRLSPLSYRRCGHKNVDGRGRWGRCSLQSQLKRQPFMFRCWNWMHMTPRRLRLVWSQPKSTLNSHLLYWPDPCLSKHWVMEFRFIGVCGGTTNRRCITIHAFLSGNMNGLRTSARQDEMWPHCWARRSRKEEQILLDLPQTCIAARDYI